MLLDLSLQPILVVPHDAPGHLVVRTLTTPTILGRVTRQEYGQTRRAKTYTHQIEPGARLVRGRTECLETRLPPIPQFDDPEANTPILPNPYEVATMWRNPVTGAFGQWRLAVQMQQRLTGTWLVTVSRVEGEPILCVAVPHLIQQEDDFRAKCVFPLNRSVQETNRPDNAWSRLVDDD